MKYLVMECHPGYAVLLDEDGRFLKAANLQYEIGQTVYDPVLMKETPEKQRHTVRWISSGVAAIAACILLFFGIGYYQNYIQLYSSIYLTINPKVQMDLNRQGTVVELTGTNEDGKKLLEGYDGRGKDKVTVADELIDRAIEMGFLAEGGQVSFSIDSPDDVLFQEYGTELRTEVMEHLDGRIAVTLEIVNHKNAEKEEGQESAFSQQTSSQPAVTSSSSSEPAQPTVTPPTSSGSTGYDDTDYGPNNDGVTDYTPPASSTPPPADTDYGPGNDGVTDYTPPASSTPAPADTDYGPGNDGVTDYTPPASSTPAPADTDYGPGNDGVTDYTPPASSAPPPADTDYGPGNDGVTDYTPPASSAPAPADTDYGPNNDGVTDYTDGNTDYDPDNGDDDDDDDNNDWDDDEDDD